MYKVVKIHVDTINLIKLVYNNVDTINVDTIVYNNFIKLMLIP